MTISILGNWLAGWLAQQANNTIKMLFFKTAESARKLLQVSYINPSDVREREKHVFYLFFCRSSRWKQQRSHYMNSLSDSMGHLYVTSGKTDAGNSRAAANHRARGAGLYCKQSCDWKNSNMYELVCFLMKWKLDYGVFFPSGLSFLRKQDFKDLFI